MPQLPFNGDASTFTGWCIQMKAMLEYMDLWEVVKKAPGAGAAPRSVIAHSASAHSADAADEVRGVDDGRSMASASAVGAASPKELKKAKQAFMVLLVNIKSQELLAQLADVPMGNACEVWTRLQTYFNRNTQANKQQMKSNFFNMKQMSGESVAAYAARLKKAVLALRDLNEPPSQADMHYAFSNGLNSSFGQMRTTMLMMPEMEFERMLDMALAIESQAAAQAGGQGGQRAPEFAHFVGGKSHSASHGQGGDRRGGSGPGPCWRCGQTGHNKASCPSPPGNFKCNHCERTGHIEAVCQTKARGAPRGPAAQQGAGGFGPSSRPAGQPVRSQAMATEQVHAQMFVAIASTSKVAKAESDASAFVVNHAASATMPAGSGPGPSVWLIDTAASSHCATVDVPMLDGAKAPQITIEVANGEKLSSPQIGTVRLTTSDGVPLVLSKVLKHEGLSRRLLSVGQICDTTDGTVTFSKTGAEVKDKEQRVVLRAVRQPGGLYTISASSEMPQAHVVETEVQHARMVHLSKSGMKKLVDAKAVSGFGDHDTECTSELCAGCMKGKAHREPFAKAMSERVVATRLLERVHADLCGPMPESFGGSKFMLLIVDEFTRKVFGFTLKKKSDAADFIIEWCRAVAAQKQVAIGEFHSDGGGEFRSAELLGFFKNTDIMPTMTLARTPQHNGIVERMNRTLLEKMIAVMEHAGATPLLWAEALKAVIHAHNHTVLRVGTQEVPEGLWRPHPTEKPSVKHLRVPFCDAWMLIPAEQQQGKLAPKAELRMLLGYDDQKRGYRLMNVHLRDVKLSRDVHFDEKSFTQCAELLAQEGGSMASLQSFAEQFSRTNFENEMRFVQKISLQEHQAAEALRGLEARQLEEQAPPVAEPVMASGGASDHAMLQQPVPAAVSPAPAAAGAASEQPEPRRGTRVKIPTEKAAAARAASVPASSEPERVRGIRFTDGGHVLAHVPHGAPPKVQQPLTPRHRSIRRWKADQGSESDSGSDSDGSFKPRHGAGAPGTGEDGVAEPRRGERERHATHQYGMVNEGDIGAGGFAALHRVHRQLVLAAAASATAAAPSSSDPEPKTFAEAMASSERAKWIAATKSELRSMRKHRVWDRVGLPRGARAIGCRWLFRRKVDGNGVVIRWKARLVAQGFAQREGVDFGETFAPVLHYKTLRVLLAMAASLDYEVLQFDVPTAFLNAECKEDVYMRAPAGLDEIGEDDGVDPSLVCKLNKTVYGIKQAPHEFYELMCSSFGALGYQRCSSDTCVFVRTSKTGRSMILPIFVDDGFPMCHTEDLPEMMADLHELMAKYDIAECNNAGVVLGMRITRDRKARTLKLDQEVYIRRVLEQHGMADCRPAATPQEERSIRQNGANADATADHGEQQDDGWRAHYGSVVGAILYIALSTRPDIAYAGGTRARFVSNPTYADWIAAKRVLRYLRGTASMGLTFGASDAGFGQGVTLAPTFCDADWAGDVSDRVSTTGFVLKVNGSTVIWGSKKQATVALSSAESEYMAAGTAGQEVLWARALLTELGFPQERATTILSDNQAAIAIGSDDVHHARTKHIDIRYHWIRQHIREGALVLEWISGAEQEADILTKPLGRVLFEKLRARVLGGM